MPFRCLACGHEEDVVPEEACPRCWHPVAGHAPLEAGLPSAWPGDPLVVPQPAPRAPGAVAALVFGILGLLLGPLGLAFAVLALVFGFKARKRIAASNGALGGSGLATAGRVLGFVWVGLVPAMVVLAGIVFVLVAGPGGANGGFDESGPQGHIQDSVVLQRGESVTHVFEVAHGRRHVRYNVSAPGSHVEARLVPTNGTVASADHRAEGLARVEAGQGEGQVILDEGRYALVVDCPFGESCTVFYNVTTQRPVANGLPPLPHGSPPDCTPPRVDDAGPEAAFLAGWHPTPTASGNYVHVEDRLWQKPPTLYTYTPPRHRVELSHPYPFHVHIAVDGRGGPEVAINTVCPRLVPGHYAQPFDGHGPGYGPFLRNFRFPGSGDCYGHGTTLLVDRAEYEGTNLVGLTLRFGNACPTGAVGEVRWDARRAADPVCVFPAPLHDPDAASLPGWEPAAAPQGTYLLVQATHHGQDPGVREWLYQGADVAVRDDYSAYVRVIGKMGEWVFNVSPLDACGRLVEGFFDGGGAMVEASWSGQDGNCQGSAGNYAIDEAVYDEQGRLILLTARFQHECRVGGEVVLSVLAKVHWQAG